MHRGVLRVFFDNTPTPFFQLIRVHSRLGGHGFDQYTHIQIVPIALANKHLYDQGLTNGLNITQDCQSGVEATHLVK